jgi:hypothetical protein
MREASLFATMKTDRSGCVHRKNQGRGENTKTPETCQTPNGN